MGQIEDSEVILLEKQYIKQLKKRVKKVIATMGKCLKIAIAKRKKINDPQELINMENIVRMLESLVEDMESNLRR